MIEGLLQEVPQELKVVLAPLVGDGPRALPLGNLVPLDPPVAREAVEVFARVDALVDGLDDGGRRGHTLRRHANIGGCGETLQFFSYTNFLPATTSSLMEMQTYQIAYSNAVSTVCRPP